MIRLLSLVMRSGEFGRSYEAAQAIRHGHVRVAGKQVTEPTHSVKQRSSVTFMGERLKQQPRTTIILDKPAGVVCQKSPREKTIYDVIATIPGIDRKTKNTLFCVGRLDRDTTGLLVVTNDGRLEKLLTRKEHHIIKTYRVTATRPVTDKDIAALREGVEIRDEDTGERFVVRALAVRRCDEKQVEMGIEEGRKRQVKKMFRAVGNGVAALKRVGIGRMRLEELNGKAHHIVRKQDMMFM